MQLGLWLASVDSNDVYFHVPVAIGNTCTFPWREKRADSESLLLDSGQSQTTHPGGQGLDSLAQVTSDLRPRVMDSVVLMQNPLWRSFMF